MACSGKQRPLHEVDQVRADVVQPLALLGGVEEPRRPDVGAPATIFIRWCTLSM